ncbi:MAG: beta-glucosidase [Proteobacteria bacterium]|nr:MAG: beta-glucosidase [Pseudomonadota bacterium]
MTAQPDSSVTAGAAADVSDDVLLELVQRQTVRFFYDFGHPVSGLARDRITRGVEPSDVVAVGGSGFGVMAIVVATEHGWVTRDEAVKRVTTIVSILTQAPRYHGAFPHFMDGTSGRTVPFSPDDDGGDLVETALLFQGLLCVRQYFNSDDPAERNVRTSIDALWNEVEWDWYARNGEALYWHWSPRKEWVLNHPIRGWNECLIAYLLAASSSTHAIEAEVYHRGWAQGPDFRNGNQYYGVELPLGPPLGGPLSFAHYSFLGLDPRGLTDRYGDYWQQNVAHTLINHRYCVANPHGFAGYGPDCWGLTAGDNIDGYAMHSPAHDVGVIAPNAAIGSLPYTPQQSGRALRHFWLELGPKLWGDCGFTSAFNQSKNWWSDSWVAIDQGPIVVMIENYRSGLLWRLFMSSPEIATGLRKLGFDSPHLR